MQTFCAQRPVTMTAHYLKKEHGSEERENSVVFPVGSRWSYQSTAAIRPHANGCGF